MFGVLNSYCAAVERRVVDSVPRELEDLVRGLAGGYIPVGGRGEPIRSPESYPSGKNAALAVALLLANRTAGRCLGR